MSNESAESSGSSDQQPVVGHALSQVDNEEIESLLKDPAKSAARTGFFACCGTSGENVDEVKVNRSQGEGDPDAQVYRQITMQLLDAQASSELEANPKSGDSSLASEPAIADASPIKEQKAGMCRSCCGQPASDALTEQVASAEVAASEKSQQATPKNLSDVEPSETKSASEISADRNIAATDQVANGEGSPTKAASDISAHRSRPKRGFCACCNAESIRSEEELVENEELSLPSEHADEQPKEALGSDEGAPIDVAAPVFYEEKQGVPMEISHPPVETQAAEVPIATALEPAKSPMAAPRETETVKSGEPRLLPEAVSPAVQGHVTPEEAPLETEATPLSPPGGILSGEDLEDEEGMYGTQAFEVLQRKYPEADPRDLKRWSSTSGCYMVWDSPARVGEDVPFPTLKAERRERVQLTTEKGSHKKVLKSAMAGFAKLCEKHDGDFVILPGRVWAREALGSLEIVWLDSENHLNFCKKGTMPMKSGGCQAVAIVDNSFRLQGGRPRQRMKPTWTKSAFATTVRSIANSVYADIDVRRPKRS